MPESTILPVFDRTQYKYTEQVKTANQELGKDQFLQILITQLQNQDPTAPMEDTAMIAQMAQFSSLESMNNLSNNFSLSQAYGMIGQGIIGTVRNAETGVISSVAGTVDSAGMLNGQPYVMVGNETVYVSNITQVFDNKIISGNAEAISAGTNMVGKYVQADVVIDEKKVTVEGLVEKLIVRDGGVYVKVGDHELGLFQITAVSNKPFPPAETKPADPNADEVAPTTDAGAEI